MEHPKLPPYDLIEVLWVDSWGKHGWRDAEDAPCVQAYCWSVGYKMQENEDGITLSGGCGLEIEDDEKAEHFECPGFIPRRTIISMVTLRKYNDGEQDTQVH